MSEQAAVEAFRRKYDCDPDVIAIAPGRINLIGEHTDYNDGFVFPAAIDQRMYVAAKLAERESELRSMETGTAKPFDARTVNPGDVKEWAAYAAGMAWAIREAGYGEMPNIQAIVSGDVPIGSGISSSAALELAFGVLWVYLAKIEIPMPRLAQIAQKCENDYVGVQSGIMDQMASAMGREGKAMFLDTRSLDIEYATVPDHLTVVLCDTKTPRALTSSAYNERRTQCEEASKALGVIALRDADLESLEKRKQAMDPVVYRRARHVITEDERCIQFKAALEQDETERLGQLMLQSHESLRDDYEVSSPALDAMAEACWAAPGCVGARMTGAGFGGACVALVEIDQLEDFRNSVLPRYKEASGREGALTACQLSDGAKAVPGRKNS